MKLQNNLTQNRQYSIKKALDKTLRQGFPTVKFYGSITTKEKLLYKNSKFNKLQKNEKKI